MDKRNRPALAYLLVGVASAGRAMLAMPDAVALQEVSLTVLALVGYLLLGRRALPVLACGTVQLVLELVLCGTLAGPAWLAPLLRAAALWLLWATVTQMLKIAGYTTGKNAKMPVVAAVPLAVYCVAHFSAVAATVASFAFIVFSIMLLWYAVLLLALVALVLGWRCRFAGPQLGRKEPAPCENRHSVLYYLISIEFCKERGLLP